MTPKLSPSLCIYYECDRQLCQLGDAQADSRLSFSLTGVRTCWHQRTFCWKLYWQVHNCKEGPQKNNLYIFLNSHCYKQCPAAETNIQLSWCIFRFSILFLMWRRWHLCSHLRSVLLVDTFESLKGKQAAMLLFQQTLEPRGSAASHLMISCDLKKERDAQGLQWRPV